MLDPDVRRIVAVDNPFEPVVVRGRVAEWLESDAAWQIIDQLSTSASDAREGQSV